MRTSLLVLAALAGCARAPNPEPRTPPRDASIAGPARSPVMPVTTPAAPRSTPTTIEELVRSLPQELATIDDGATLGAFGERIASIPGVRSVDLDKPRWSRTMMLDPIDVDQVIAWLGLGEAYAISGDTHQQSWFIVIRTGPDTIDSYQHRRLPAEAPRYGRWVVELHLDGRPKLPLPGLSYGASPAYALAGSGSKVRAIEFDEM